MILRYRTNVEANWLQPCLGAWDEIARTEFFGGLPNGRPIYMLVVGRKAHGRIGRR